MSRRRPRIIAAAALAAAACAIPSADEFARGPGVVATPAGDASPIAPVMNDAGTSDAGASDAGASDGGAPVANLIAGTGGTFEDGTCGDNAFFQSKGNAVQPGHSGTWACRLCREGTNEDYSLNPLEIVRSPEIGAVYRASVWVRAAAPTDLSQSMFVSIRLRNDGPFEQLDATYSEPVPLTDTWTKIEGTLTVKKSAQSLDAYVYAKAGVAGGEKCFVTDDFIVWRER